MNMNNMNNVGLLSYTLEKTVSAGKFVAHEVYRVHAKYFISHLITYRAVHISDKNELEASQQYLEKALQNNPVRIPNT